MLDKTHYATRKTIDVSPYQHPASSTYLLFFGHQDLTSYEKFSICTYYVNNIIRILYNILTKYVILIT